MHGAEGKSQGVGETNLKVSVGGETTPHPQKGIPSKKKAKDSTWRCQYLSGRAKEGQSGQAMEKKRSKKLMENQKEDNRRVFSEEGYHRAKCHRNVKEGKSRKVSVGYLKGLFLEQMSF